jgi:hypothetical protein
MTRRLAISLILLAFSAHGAAPSTPASSDALDNDLTDDARPAAPSKVAPAPVEHVTTVRVVAPPAPP